MDLLHWLLALVTLLAPLVAAAATAASGSMPLLGSARRLANFGAAIAFAAAAAGLVQGAGPFAPRESVFTLGVWLDPGVRSGLVISLGIDFNPVGATLAAAIALSAWCALRLYRSEVSDGPSERQFYAWASILLFAAIAVALSSNLAELALFWQLASGAAFVLSLTAFENEARPPFAKKLILVQRISDAFLLCAVLGFAAAFPTLEFHELFGPAGVWARGIERHPALADFIGLCLLGACVGRCALVPALNWTGDLIGGPTLIAVLLEGICLMPAGAVLLYRCAPVFYSAIASSALAAFVGALSAFAAAVCALAGSSARRTAAFACASLFGLIVVGAATGPSVGGPWGLVVAGALAPSSVVILGAVARPLNTFNFGWDRVPLVVSIAALFSGICGQGTILAAAIQHASRQRAAGADATLSAIVAGLSAFAMLFAAYAVSRPDRRGGRDESTPDSSESTIIEVAPVDNDVARRWPTVIAAACGLAIALAAVVAPFLGRQTQGSVREAAWPLVGCLPAVAGLFAGALPSWSSEVERSFSNSLLMRLGRRGFYFNGLLFLLIGLPMRGLAQLARFADWFFVDGFIAQGPANAVETAAVLFEPVQRRSTTFYLVSAFLGTALLAVVIIWLRD